MKKIDLHPGGHRRSNDDLMHLQGALIDVIKGYNSRYSLPNTSIVGVTLSGVIVTPNGALFDLSNGAVAVGEGVYEVNATTGLDTSGGKKIFLSKNTINGSSVAYANGVAQFVHKNDYLTAYTATAKNNPNDYELGTEIVPNITYLQQLLSTTFQPYITPASWLPITPLLNAEWTINSAYPTLQYRKSGNEVVHLQGTIKANPSLPFSPIICYLPVGFRPNLQEIRFYTMSTHTYSGKPPLSAEIIIGSDGRIAIETNGTALPTSIQLNFAFSFAV